MSYYVRDCIKQYPGMDWAAGHSGANWDPENFGALEFLKCCIEIYLEVIWLEALFFFFMNLNSNGEDPRAPLEY